MSEQESLDKKPLFSGEPFKRLTALLISAVALLVTLSNFMHAEALSHFSESVRDAQQFSVQAMGLKARGEMEAGYAYSDAFRLWFELDSLRFLADESGDADATRRYTALRDQIAELSPLLNEPYFDSLESDVPDILAFEADAYLVETTILSEKFANASQVARIWRAKADAYRNHLILFALALFLYGLSTTFDEKMRWIFVGVGTLIANVAMVWLVVVTLTPVHSLPQAAIAAYAQGVGLAHQDDFAGANEAFDQALAMAPSYGNAFYDRGNAFYELGDFDQAAADYEAALAAGKTDIGVTWNLGWTYYVLGRLEDATHTTEMALETDPGQVGLLFNLGVMHLAQGDLEAAQVAYSDGMALAARQVTEAKAADQEPPASLWWYLSTATLDLSNLLNCMYDQICKETPAYETITAPKRSFIVREAGEDLRLQLKTLNVALEHTGQPSAAPVAAHIGPFAFSRRIYDAQGQLADATTLDAEGPRLRFGRIQEEESEFAQVNISRAGADAAGQVFVSFDYEGMQEGQLVVIKVYHDGQEAPELRLIEKWSRGSQGEAALPLTPAGYYNFAPGDYQVEIYVDAQLVQQGEFTIKAP